MGHLTFRCDYISTVQPEPLSTTSESSLRQVTQGIFNVTADVIDVPFELRLHPEVFPTLAYLMPLVQTRPPRLVRLTLNGVQSVFGAVHVVLRVPGADSSTLQKFRAVGAQPFRV